jgi:sialidase-1
MDIVIMQFVDPDKMRDYRSGTPPGEIQNHEKVAAHYQVSTINLAREVTDRIDNGEFSWEKDFKDLHPSPFGQHIYYRSIQTLLENCWADSPGPEEKIKDYPLPDKLASGCYNSGKLIPAVQLKPAKGWSVVVNWKPSDGSGTRPDFADVPMLNAEGPTGALEFRFEGNAVGIAVAAGQDAGILEYRIDKGSWQKQDLFTAWSSQLHLPWFYTLAYDLKPGKHSLTIRQTDEKNARSRGTACRIRYFYVNSLE